MLSNTGSISVNFVSTWIDMVWFEVDLPSTRCGFNKTQFDVNLTKSTQLDSIGLDSTQPKMGSFGFYQKFFRLYQNYTKHNWTWSNISMTWLHLTWSNSTRPNLNTTIVNLTWVQLYLNPSGLDSIQIKVGQTQLYLIWFRLNSAQCDQTRLNPMWVRLYLTRCGLLTSRFELGLTQFDSAWHIPYLPWLDMCLSWFALRWVWLNWA